MPKRKNTSKDPNKPKRPCSSFMIFSNEKRPDLSKLYPGEKITQLSKKIGIMWKNLPPEKKKKYEEQSRRACALYQELKKNYIPPKIENLVECSEEESSD